MKSSFIKKYRQNISQDSDDIVELQPEDWNQEKSISIAMDELLNNKLEYRDIDEPTTDEEK